MLLVITLHPNGKIDLNSQDVAATGRAVELLHGPDPDRSPLREIAARVHEAGRSLPSDTAEIFDRADQAGLATIGFTHVALVTLEHPGAMVVRTIVVPAEPQPIGDLALADLFALYRDGSRTRAGVDCYEMMPVGNPPTELLVIGFEHVGSREPTWPRAASGMAIVATRRRLRIWKPMPFDGREPMWTGTTSTPGEFAQQMHHQLHTTADLERVIAWTRGA